MRTTFIYSVSSGSSAILSFWRLPFANFMLILIKVPASQRIRVVLIWTTRQRMANAGQENKSCMNSDDAMLFTLLLIVVAQ